MNNQRGLSFIEVVVAVLMVGAFCVFVSHRVSSYRPTGTFVEIVPSMGR